MPEFVGNNRVGAVFACICIFFYEGRNLLALEAFRLATSRKEKIRAVGAFLMAHWKSTLRLWAVVIVAFWIGHTFDLVYQNANNLTSQKQTLTDAVSTNISTCISEKNELRVAGSADRSRAETLSKQNIDQQNSINGCQSEAIKRLIPDMENHGSYEVLGMGNEHLKAYIYTTNRTIPRTAIVLRCDRDVTDIDAFIMGNPSRFLPRYASTGPHQYVFQTPADWTPNSPIQINLSFAGEVPNCTLQRNER